jgi:hypothetical protein
MQRLPWPVCIALLLGILTSPVFAQDDPRQNPYFAVPELRQLMEWATLQLTFDGGSLIPDMASGESKPAITGTPQFEPGLRGQALVAGDGSGIGLYPKAGNAPFDTQGALALWICPVSWTHVQGGNTTLVMTTNASFYVQRQGPLIEGPVLKRAEGLQFLLFSKTVGNQCLMYGTNDWPIGQWRLLVANWSWPTMSFSIDGGEFQSGTVKGKPAAAEFGGIVVGANGGEKTLLDEVTFFRRPLTAAEVKVLYEALKPH